MPPSSEKCPLVNEVLPPEITPFFHNLCTKTEEIAFDK